MARAKKNQEDENIVVDDKQLEDKQVEKKVVQKKSFDKRIVYIGTTLKTPSIIINRFTTLLDKPKNWDDMISKSKDLEKLFVTVDFFSKNLQQIKASVYYKQLTKKVQKELGGN